MLLAVFSFPLGLARPLKTHTGAIVLRIRHGGGGVVAGKKVGENLRPDAELGPYGLNRRKPVVDFGRLYVKKQKKKRFLPFTPEISTRPRVFHCFGDTVVNIIDFLCKNESIYYHDRALVANVNN